jgi:hypothetical protein
LVVLGILIVGCKREGAVKIEEARESTSQLKSMSGLRNVIEIKAERGILHYQKESLRSFIGKGKLMGQEQQ